MPTKSRKPRPPIPEPTQRISLDVPLDLLAAIDVDANRIGVTRQAWIKIRLADYLDRRDQVLNCLRDTNNHPKENGK
jgi:hypothetical protein